MTLAAISLIGCGGAKPGEAKETDGDYDEVLESVRPLLVAQCEWFFSCCDGREQIYQLGGAVTDVDSCVSRVEEIWLTSSSGASPIPSSDFNLGLGRFLTYLAYDLDEGRVRLDADGLSACAEELSARSCNPVLFAGEGERCVPPPLPELDSACQLSKMIVGLQGEGQACRTGSPECAEGLLCSGVGPEGRCIEAAQEGTACFADYQCPSPLVCDWMSGRCAEGVAAGGACSFSDPENPTPGTELLRCAPGLACDPVMLLCGGTECAAGSSCGDDEDCPEGLFCVTGRCGTPGGVGDECWNDDDCEVGWCDWNTSTCDGPLPNGADCDDHRACASGWCAWDDSFTIRSCTASVAPGMECPSFEYEECAGGWCDTSVSPPVCVADGGPGASCDDDGQCDATMELVCVNNNCATIPLDNGSACNASSQCASGLCFESSCSAGAGVGDNCDISGTSLPCASGHFCELGDDGETGLCRALGGAGAACSSSLECWGSCTVQKGLSLCTPSNQIPGVAYCDGM